MPPESADPERERVVAESVRHYLESKAMLRQVHPPLPSADEHARNPGEQSPAPFEAIRRHSMRPFAHHHERPVSGAAVEHYRRQLDDTKLPEPSPTANLIVGAFVGAVISGLAVHLAHALRLIG